MIDFVSLALDVELEGFTAQCGFPFLLSINEPVELDSQPPEQTTLIFSKEPPQTPMQPATGRPVLHAVKKEQMLIPQSIILGRASTSDIVINDRQISKMHALFQNVGDHWELSDAGSRNGTWVGHRQLTPRGEAAAVQSFDILSFGHRAYLFLEAGDCWQEIRNTAARK
jgi:FHA domain